MADRNRNPNLIVDNSNKIRYKNNYKYNYKIRIIKKSTKIKNKNNNTYKLRSKKTPNL